MSTSRFDKPVAHLGDQLAGIRPGTIGVGFVETFRYEGAMLRDVAAVVGDKGRVHVFPHDRSACHSIANALAAGKLNAYVLNPSTVCVPVPPMSGEQKEEMARHVRGLGEAAKVAVRAIRREARDAAGDDKAAEKAIQKDTDEAIARIDSLVRAKIAEL